MEQGLRARVGMAGEPWGLWRVWVGLSPASRLSPASFPLDFCFPVDF